MHSACRAGAADTVRALLRDGRAVASLATRDDAGYTALLYACGSQSLETMRILLAHEEALPTVNWTTNPTDGGDDDDHVLSPVYLACGWGDGAEEALDLLVEHGANVAADAAMAAAAAAREEAALRLLLWACERGHTEALTVLKPHLVAWLVAWREAVKEAKAAAAGLGEEMTDPAAAAAVHWADWRDLRGEAKSARSEGNGLLHLICKKGNEEGLRVLLAAGARGLADIGRKNARGETALFTAVAAGHVGCASELLRLVRGEKWPSSVIDAREYVRGETALARAAFQGDQALVSALLESGASPTVADFDGRDPLFWAEERGHAGIANDIRYFTNIHAGKYLTDVQATRDEELTPGGAE